MAPERNEGDAPRPASAPIAPSSVLSAREFASRYAAVEVLGESALGKTYRARDRSRDGREVSLAVIAARYSRESELAERFFQDVRTAQSLVSPHLVEILDLGQIEDGRLFVATEIVEGEPLRTRLAREGTLRPTVALEIARQTLAALAAGHQKGLAHGNVGADSIWLQARVPKTRENPEGVLVRLFGFGLVALHGVPERPAENGGEPRPRADPTTAEDVHASAELLLAMLGRAGEGGEALAELDKDLRALLQRGLSRERPFASAAEFAQAIKSLRTYSSRPPLPRWAIAGLALLGLAAVAEGFWLLEQRSQAHDLELHAAELQATRLDFLRQEEAKCQARLDEMERTIRSREADIRELIGQIEAAKLAVRDASAATGDGANLLPELERMKGELQTAERERLELAETLREKQTRVRDLENQNQTLAMLSKPEARTARGFDQLIEHLQAGRGQQALAFFRELDERGVVPAGEQRTRTMLSNLAQCSAALEDFERNRDPQSLDAARHAYDTALGETKGFAVEASAWIDFQVETGRDPKRLEDLDAVAEKLELDLDTAAAMLARAHAEDWSELESRAAAVEPATVLEHARDFRCEHLAQWVERWSATWQAELVRDGALDVERLCVLPRLDAWSEALGADPELARLSGASEIADLASARDWYCTRSLAAPPRLARAEFAALTREPASDWRWVAALQLELAGPDSGFPIREGEALVYRDVDPSRGTTAWYIDELADSSESSGSRTWSIRRHIYTSDGTVPSSAIDLEITRRGALFLRAGRELFDLKGHGANVAAAAWSAPAIETLPRKSWFPAAAGFESFKAELAAHPAPCLLVRDKSITRMFSPRYGLVLEEDPKLFRLELVYAGPKP